MLPLKKPQDEKIAEMPEVNQHLIEHSFKLKDLSHSRPGLNIQHDITRHMESSFQIINNLSLTTNTDSMNVFFTEVFLVGLVLSNPESKIMFISKLFHTELGENKKEYIFMAISKIIDLSAIDYPMFLSLKMLAENESIQSIVTEDNRIDSIIINSINSTTVLAQAPYDHFKIYSRLIYLSMQHNNERLIAVLQKINFHSQNGLALAQAFYENFIDTTTIDATTKSTLFIDALAESLKIQYFSDQKVIYSDLEETTIQALNHYISHENTPLLVTSIKRAEEERGNINLRAYSFFSFYFLLFSRVGSRLSDQLSWHRIMYWLGTKNSVQENLIIGQNLYLDFPAYDNIFQDLLILLECLERFFHMVKFEKENHIKLYTFVMEKIIDAARLENRRGQSAFLTMIEKTFSPLFDIEKDYLQDVLLEKNKIDSYNNGFDAVYNIFQDSFRGDNPENWNAKSLQDKLLFLHSFITTPLETYKQWFIEANRESRPGQTDIYHHRDYIEDKISDIIAFKSRLLGLDCLPEIGFRVLQKNQIVALMCAIEPPDNAKNIFSRIGTGQGKSLISALTALHYANQGRRVLIVTCYHNLAQRDYERFLPLFKKYNITSQLITDGNNVNDAKIIYSELNTYFIALRAQASSRASRTFSTENNFDYFSPDILILDEADSLLEDASTFGRQVKDHKETLMFPEVKPHHFESAEIFQKLLSIRPEYSLLIEALEKHDLLSIYTHWFQKACLDNKEAEERINQLGIKNNIIGGMRRELLRGKCYFASIYISVLTFLTASTFERVIGFSGTVDRNSFQRYQQIYPSTEFTSIPSFHGQDLQKKEICAASAVELSPSDWEKLIIEDVTLALERGQPILVFADIASTEPLNANKETEWDIVKKCLKNIVHEQGIRFQIIDSESSASSLKITLAGMPETITLASHVVARGTDFALPRAAIINGGMHVLITYSPTRNDKLDENMLEQMKGRVGRMGNPGSYSIIIRKIIAAIENRSPLRNDPDHSKYHDLIKEAYKILSAEEHPPETWRKWLLLNWWISSSSNFPEMLKKQGTAHAQAIFLVDNFLRTPIVTATPVSSEDQQKEEEAEEKEGELEEVEEKQFTENSQQDSQQDTENLSDNLEQSGQPHTEETSENFSQNTREFENDLQESIFSDESPHEPNSELPIIADTIELEARKKMILRLKYLNAVMINWLVFFYTLPQYAIYFHFTDDDLNECSTAHGNFVLPYQPCSIDEMFRLNSAGSAHIIQNNTACLPDYLTGASVQLESYNTYNGDLLDQNTSSSLYTLGLQGFTNCILTLFLLPVLFIIEKHAARNRENFKNSTLTLSAFLVNALFNFLQYYFIIECMTFGAINQVIVEEHCDSLYTPNTRLNSSIGIISVSLISASAITLYCLIEGVIDKRSPKKSCEIITRMCQYAVTIGGLGVHTYNSLTALDAVTRVPNSIVNVQPTLYVGGYSKMFSLILLFEHLLSTFDIPRFFTEENFPLLLWNAQPAPAPTVNHDLEQGSYQA